MSRFGERLHKGWRGARNQARLALAGTAVFLLALLLGIHLFFPTAAVQRWLGREIEARTSATVQFTKMSLRPFFTLSDNNVAVTFDKSGGRSFILDELRLKPLWSSLISGDPGISVQAALLQGRLDATLRRSGDLTLHATGIKLTDFPVHQESRTLLSGTIVKGDLQGSFPARKGTETRLSLEIDSSSLTVLGQPLPLGKIALEGSGQGNNLRITTLSASGGELIIAGTGNLLLGTSAATSRISLDVSLRPAPSAPPALAALLDLSGKRQADNSYRLQLNGVLGQLTGAPAASTGRERTRARQNAEDDE
jgi:type II secretion system protein N